jgi:hypothetical protein
VPAPGVPSVKCRLRGRCRADRRSSRRAGLCCGVASDVKTAAFSPDGTELALQHGALGGTLEVISLVGDSPRVVQASGRELDGPAAWSLPVSRSRTLTFPVQAVENRTHGPAAQPAQSSVVRQADHGGVPAAGSVHAAARMR